MTADVYGFRQANLLQRTVRATAAWPPVSWLYARTLHHLDRLVYRLTGGRATFVSWVAGLPVVMLTTTGARTGRARTVPVLGLSDADGLVVIASNFGRAHHPAWYHNLRADPRASIVVDGVATRLRARELSGAERERHFRRGVAVNPGWVRYRRRARRHIPVILLTPAPTEGHTDG
jgi:deazaflavin-dependent oxidoreductase (nitroreductase family)